MDRVKAPQLAWRNGRSLLDDDMIEWQKVNPAEESPGVVKCTVVDSLARA
ncbi:MAG TPA: hypothetical protein VGG17_10420 [Acidimicrobiales bacterium]